MTEASAYNSLLEHFRSILALQETQSLLHWDQETMMPKKGIDTRGEELAALEAAIHQKLTEPRVREWLEAVATPADDPVASGNVREMRRMVERATKVPQELTTELARLAPVGQRDWLAARASGRFDDFVPTLQRIVALKRSEAQAIAPTDHLYDALLDEFEPEMQTSRVQELFERLRPKLRNLLERIVEKRPAQQPLATQVGPAFQMRLAERTARVLGYDFDAGRLDLAVHPFTAGGTPGDVRITTRVDENELTDCLFSTIHEVGHALYEQGIDPSLQLTPVGRAASFGVHESQSRLWENQVARGAAFAHWLYAACRDAVGALAVTGEAAFYRAINQVHPSTIRTEADEVTYNLHIIVRFELELALLDESLAVSDLEAAWNEKMQEHLGVRPSGIADGVLQDIHWAAGLLGYFPTYALGNIYAAELFAAMRRDLPDLDTQLRRAEVGPMREWLRERIHSRGRLHPPTQLISQAIGHEPTEAALVDYLETKFSELYAL